MKILPLVIGIFFNLWTLHLNWTRLIWYLFFWTVGRVCGTAVPVRSKLETNCNTRHSFNEPLKTSERVKRECTIWSPSGIKFVFIYIQSDSNKVEELNSLICPPHFFVNQNHDTKKGRALLGMILPSKTFDSWFTGSRWLFCIKPNKQKRQSSNHETFDNLESWR